MLVDWLDAEAGCKGLVNHPMTHQHGLHWEDDFLGAGLSVEKLEHNVPVLWKGLVRTVRFETRQSIFFQEVQDWAKLNDAYVGDEIIGNIPDALAARATKAFSKCIG